MDDMNTTEDLDTKSAAKIAIQRFQNAASDLTDDEVMDMAHNSLDYLRKANGRLNKTTIPKAICMAGAFAEINIRRETLFEPIGERSVEESYRGIFDYLDTFPDFVASTITTDDSFNDSALETIGEVIIKICMFTTARSGRFNDLLAESTKESQRKQAKEEKVELRRKQRESQMTPGRFWTLLVLGILGFLIIVGSL
ncbi:MAG: hypothetical protein ACPG6L_09920 [Nereida ignava]